MGLSQIYLSTGSCLTSLIQQGGYRLKTLLIYGVESVAGANIANTLSEHYHVVGIAIGQCPEIEHCQMLSGEAALDPPGHILKDLNPDYVIDATCCGDSAWNPDLEIGDEYQCSLAVERAAICQRLGSKYTLLSSDAVFAGPWMFHEEGSEFSCSFPQGKRLIQLEDDVRQACSDSLIVRTNLFGWNWLENKTGWIESLLHRMQMTSGACHELSFPGHATPIFTTDLAWILARGFEENLTGTFHICGAERVNRQQFASKLAETFNINWHRESFSNEHFSLSERNHFACGETSLQTRNIRKSLCVAMPTLTAGMALLLSQQPARKLQDEFTISEAEFSRAA
ncbi:MAG: sugar nucleotide-binding protein [Planctomycetaceae bacterium]|nr:sugar nucleotide-binding protein [Planctomycetaceae bacterium]